MDNHWRLGGKQDPQGDTDLTRVEHRRLSARGFGSLFFQRRKRKDTQSARRHSGKETAMASDFFTAWVVKSPQPLLLKLFVETEHSTGEKRVDIRHSWGQPNSKGPPPARQRLQYASIWRLLRLRFLNYPGMTLAIASKPDWRAQLVILRQLPTASPLTWKFFSSNATWIFKVSTVLDTAKLLARCWPDTPISKPSATVVACEGCGSESCSFNLTVFDDGSASTAAATGEFLQDALPAFGT